MEGVSFLQKKSVVVIKFRENQIRHVCSYITSPIQINVSSLADPDSMAVIRSPFLQLQSQISIFIHRPTRPILDTYKFSIFSPTKLPFSNSISSKPTSLYTKNLHSEKSMELQLSLSLPTDLDPSVNGFLLKNHKRFFEEAFADQDGSSDKGPSLLARSGMANKDDDDPEEPCKRSFSSIRKDDGDKNKIVGWPPVKAWRKKQFHQDQHRAAVMENDRMAQHDNHKYVKVKMEGIAIGRKINLSIHYSYQTLQASLITMFATHYDQKWKDGGESFTLTYQDQEGNWLLAGDLPWQSFVGSVRSMKMTKKKTELKV